MPEFNSVVSRRHHPFVDHNSHVGHAPRATVERLVVETTVRRPPAVVYEFLEDFPGYASYSEHLREVRAEGSGEDRCYALTFAWWKLSYTVRTAVTDLDPPSRIAWRVVSDLDASGRWEVEPVGGDEERAVAADGNDLAEAARVTFVAEYDPSSVTGDSLDLPSFVSLDWVVRKAKPLIEAEARRVVERAVADLEGEPRDVELEVTMESG